MRFRENELPQHIRNQIKRADKKEPQILAVTDLNSLDDTQSMNKTERRFYEFLQAQSDIVHIDFNVWRCKIAEGAWYKPDFLVIRDTGRVEIYEVKGFWRSRDRVRTKVAASSYPYFNWFGAQYEKGQWKFEEFK